MFEHQRLESLYDWLLWAIAQNLLVTAALIPIVWLLCWGFRTRPAVQHLLWLIVLVKFVTPPLPGLMWQLPEFAKAKPTEHAAAWEPLPAESILDASIEFEPAYLDASQLILERAVEPPTSSATIVVDAKYFDPYLLLMVVWGLGAAAWAAVYFRKTWRCYRLVRSGSGATVRLARIVGRVAGSMGLRRLETTVVSRIASPFLCCVGRVRLAWPQSLLTIDEASIAVIAAHEAAHLRRKDHLVAWIELAASIAWWWNPLFWFVRRQMRNAAELSCDAMALEAYPEDRCLYAETLLWLSAGIKAGAPPLQLAIGSGAPSSIERRIHMIATDHVSGKLSISGTVLAALLVLGTLPGWSIAQTEVGKSEATFEEGSPAGQTAAIGFVEGKAVLLDMSQPSGEGGSKEALTLTANQYLVEEGGADLTVIGTTPAGGSGPPPATGTIQAGTMPGGEQPQAAAPTTSSSLARQVLRIKAMHLVAMSENRTADAEALATAIRILEASPEVAAKVAKMELVIATDRLYTAESNADQMRRLYRSTGELKRPLGIAWQSGNVLRGLNGLALRRKITGSNVGAVWGNGVYTDDSPVATAAVHAGLVKLGETKDIVLVVEPGQQSYVGDVRNGISSSDYGSWPGSYRLMSVEDRPDAVYLCQRMSDNPSASFTLQSLDNQAPIKPGTTLVVPLIGYLPGTVWGSGPYTADSNLDTAVVHTGFLPAGQAGLFKITVMNGRDSYADSTANGVTTRAYGPWDMSFKIEPIGPQGKPQTPEPDAQTPVFGR